MVKAGMQQAREHGKHIGRPPVTERPEFILRFAATKERLSRGELSRRRAAKELGIGYATLARLLAKSMRSVAVKNNIDDSKTLSEVLY
jgi:DNA invertase Pin-like site-specific DNA recombinase